VKLLFVTPQLPFPPDQGTKLRNGPLIRIAAEAGHEVHLLAFGKRDASVEPTTSDPSSDSCPEGAELDNWCRRVVVVPSPPARKLVARARDIALSQRPDLVDRLWSPGFYGALRRLVAEERYDAVQVEGMELTRYLPATAGALTIFDDHNVEYSLQQLAFQTDVQRPRRAHAALYSFIQWRRLRLWEARVCTKVDAVLAASRQDAAVLQRLSGRDVDAVPNGIDLTATPFHSPKTEIAANLLFDGTMSFRPNHDAATWFIQEILPLVRAKRPDVRFWVVGRDPLPDVVAHNFSEQRVAVTGAVPSVDPYWDRAGVYVLPMRFGGGVRFKALQAMARGVPLVSTALGVEGLDAQPGRDYLRAERPHDFAAAILKLLDDAASRELLATNARRTVANLDWSRIAPALLGVYERLENRTRGRA
jgi:glycosyltransferase involved in cell wall biosynthesis